MNVEVRSELARLFDNDEFAQAMEYHAQAFSQYRGRLPAIPYAYTRTRLYACPQYEIVAMQWAPGSVSPIHDHGNSRCWVLMLAGALDVQNFQREGDLNLSPVTLRETERITVGTGEIDHRLTPREFHRVANTGNEPAFSLQLYAEPITSFTIVDAHTRNASIVTAITDLEITI